MVCDNTSRLHHQLSINHDVICLFVNHDVIAFLYITFSLVGMFIWIRDESHIWILNFDIVFDLWNFFLFFFIFKMWKFSFIFKWINF
jgi:hypothetical protein